MPATATIAPPCTAPPPNTTIDWREVRAAQFTFCVPASWRSQGNAPAPELDARTWRTGASTSITWGTGVPPDRRVIATETVVVRQGDPIPPPTSRADVRRYNELLGGRTAEVYEMKFKDLYHTEARWRDPGVYLQGETRDLSSMQLLLAIHRTVRFTGGS